MGEIAGLMGRIAKEEGHNNTNIPGVRIYKASEYRPRHPLCYGKGIIIVGQGNKRVFLGDKVYEYNPDNYLVLSVALPAECETEATEYEPLLSLMVDIDMGMLNRIVEQMGNDINPSLWGQKDRYTGLFVAHANQDIKDAVVRLLRSLLSPGEGKVIGPGIVHELIFRIMNGENAAPLYALIMINTNLSIIDKALRHIHEEYRHPINIDKLSRLVNMSPSAFFRAVKEVTASSPIQYLKKVRLNIAMGLLMANQVRVNEAATEVGYESTTQFSREFKRYFGNSPVSFIPEGKIKLPLKRPSNQGYIALFGAQKSDIENYIKYSTTQMHKGRPVIWKVSRQFIIKKMRLLILILALILSACANEPTEEKTEDYSSCDIQTMLWDTNGGGAIEFEVNKGNDAYFIEVMEHEYKDTSIQIQLTTVDIDAYTMVNKIFNHELNLYEETIAPSGGSTGTWTSINLACSNGETVKISNIKAYGDLSVIPDFIIDSINKI